MKSKPHPTLRRLEPFVGKWKLKGQQHDSPFGPAAKISAVKKYRWLEGGFFLVHRLKGRVGGRKIACVEIIGRDAAGQSYQTRAFYSDGTTKTWQARERRGGWTLTGGWKTGERTEQVRCTTVFSEGGTTMTEKWERSSAGSGWKTFWDVIATKIS